MKIGAIGAIGESRPAGTAGGSKRPDSSKAGSIPVVGGATGPDIGVPGCRAEGDPEPAPSGPRDTLAGFAAGAGGEPDP